MIGIGIVLGVLITYLIANQVVRRLREKLHHEELTSLKWLHNYENAADDVARLEGDLKRTDDAMYTAITTKNGEIERLTKERDAAREGTDAVLQSYIRLVKKFGDVLQQLSTEQADYDALLEKLLDAEAYISDLKTRVIQ